MEQPPKVGEDLLLRRGAAGRLERVAGVVGPSSREVSTVVGVPPAGQGDLVSVVDEG
jgi:hypothetical protein